MLKELEGERMLRGAVFDASGVYRYALTREWGPGPGITFVMLNPSTADEQEDDPTIRKCIGFADRLGCGKLAVVNLFAYRATKPPNFSLIADPVGPDNDTWIVHCVRQATLVVAAWGNHGTLHDRGVAVERLVTAWKPLHCLALTKAGMPGHPLYLPKTARPQPYLPIVGAA